MNVLILTSLFCPEIAANSKRMTHLAQGLKEDGHNVSVITAFPYYSTARERSGDAWVRRDDFQGIPIFRTYTYRPKKYADIPRRLLSFLSFSLSSIFGAFKVQGPVEAVVVISPPFLNLLSGYLISRIKRARLMAEQ